MADIDKADMACELIVEELEVDIISVYFCLCLLNISVTVTKVLSSGWKEKWFKFNQGISIVTINSKLLKAPMDFTEKKTH